MRLVIAKSTFDHPLGDGTVSPGQPLMLEDEMAASMAQDLLVEPPRPSLHFNIEEGPTTADDERTGLYHKGGGSYLVVGEDGTILNEEPLRGADAARAFAKEHTSTQPDE